MRPGFGKLLCKAPDSNGFRLSGQDGVFGNHSSLPVKKQARPMCKSVGVAVCQGYPVCKIRRWTGLGQDQTFNPVLHQPCTCGCCRTSKGCRNLSGCYNVQLPRAVAKLLQEKVNRGAPAWLSRLSDRDQIMIRSDHDLRVSGFGPHIGLSAGSTEPA